MSTDLSKSYPSAGFICSEALRQINSQIDHGKQVEGKANILTGFTGVAAANLIAATTHPWFVWVQIGLVAATFVCGYRALHTRNYATSLDLEWMTGNLLVKAEDESRFTLIESAKGWIEQNDLALASKAAAFDWELNFFMMAIAAIIIGKILT